MKKSILIGCIHSLKRNVYGTRFFYFDTTSLKLEDVTAELCMAIQVYNQQVQVAIDSGTYGMKIPYDFVSGLAMYSHGCGLTHYLQENVFDMIYAATDNLMPFPLPECRISVFTPDDLKNIFNLEKGAFDPHIKHELTEYFTP